MAIYGKASRTYSYPLRIEKYTFQENDETYSKIERIGENVIVCKKCGKYSQNGADVMMKYMHWYKYQMKKFILKIETWLLSYSLKS